MITDLKQTELDIVEQKILTELFGGYSPENMVLKKGIFKINVADDVQKYINMFEDFVKPLMDDQGYINGAELKQYIDSKISWMLPNGNFRLGDVYDLIAPIAKRIIGVGK
jgi:hypothetical protein